MVVDRYSKYSHFIALKHPFTAVQVAQLFLDHVYKLHELPKSITSDRDKVFIRQFWQYLFKSLGTKQQLSTAYHPQTDGETETVNRCLETNLKCMTSERPKHWSKWLALAEYWYNTNFHSSLQMIPFEVLYNTKPQLSILHQIPDCHRSGQGFSQRQDGYGSSY